CVLGLPFVLLIVIFDPGHPRAGLVGENARYRRPGTNFGSSLARLAKISHLRIGERPDRTADVAPSVVDAGGPAPRIHRGPAHRRRYERDADGFKPLHEDVAIPESLHRRHRIGFAGGPPFFLGPRIAGDADLARDLVVVGGYIVVRYGPIVAPTMLAFHSEIG